MPDLGNYIITVVDSVAVRHVDRGEAVRIRLYLYFWFGSFYLNF